MFRSPWNDETAYSFISSLPSSAGSLPLAALPRFLEPLKQTASAWTCLRGNAMRGLRTAVLKRGNGISRTCTRDGDSRRFPFLTLPDPVDES